MVSASAQISGQKQTRVNQEKRMEHVMWAFQFFWLARDLATGCHFFSDRARDGNWLRTIVENRVSAVNTR